ncbi:MAG TPA: hypothetical protein VJB90_02345 [Candidatus Nanoarchaeia archaeon]|nr:hypothetical protein [Candidatus Nanoarchaeia archaeon]
MATPIKERIADVRNKIAAAPGKLRGNNQSPQQAINSAQIKVKNLGDVQNALAEITRRYKLSEQQLMKMLQNVGLRFRRDHDIIIAEIKQIDLEGKAITKLEKDLQALKKTIEAEITTSDKYYKEIESYSARYEQQARAWKAVAQPNGVKDSGTALKMVKDIQSKLKEFTREAANVRARLQKLTQEVTATIMELQAERQALLAENTDLTKEINEISKVAVIFAKADGVREIGEITREMLMKAKDEVNALYSLYQRHLSHRDALKAFAQKIADLQRAISQDTAKLNNELAPMKQHQVVLKDLVHKFEDVKDKFPKKS